MYWQCSCFACTRCACGHSRRRAQLQPGWRQARARTGNCGQGRRLLRCGAFELHCRRRIHAWSCGDGRFGYDGTGSPSGKGAPGNSIERLSWAGGRGSCLAVDTPHAGRRVACLDWTYASLAQLHPAALWSFNPSPRPRHAHAQRTCRPLCIACRACGCAFQRCWSFTCTGRTRPDMLELGSQADAYES